MKLYRVTWNETYLCSRVVGAENEDDALAKVQEEEMNGKAAPDHKDFGGYDLWETDEVKEG